MKIGEDHVYKDCPILIIAWALKPDLIGGSGVCTEEACALYDEDNSCCSLNAKSRLNIKEQMIEW